MVPSDHEFPDVPRGPQEVAREKREGGRILQTARYVVAEYLRDCLESKRIEGIASYAVDWVLDRNFRQRDPVRRSIAIRRFWVGRHEARPAIIVQDGGGTLQASTLGGGLSIGRWRGRTHGTRRGLLMSAPIEVSVVGRGDTMLGDLQDFVTLALGPVLSAHNARTFYGPDGEWQYTLQQELSLSAGDEATTEDQAGFLGTRTVSVNGLFSTGFYVRPHSGQATVTVLDRARKPEIQGVPSTMKPRQRAIVRLVGAPLATLVVEDPRVAYLESENVLVARRPGSTSVAARLPDQPDALLRVPLQVSR